MEQPFSADFSAAEDTLLLDAVGRMCGHERLMDVAAVDMAMDHADWVHIARHEFSATKLPTQCKYR